MAKRNSEINGVPVSSSVQAATEALPADEPVTAWAIVAEILKLHPEYGRSMGYSILKMAWPSEGHAQPLPDWFSDLAKLFDMRRVIQSVEVVDGRLAIWGLAKLDDGLWAELYKSGFVEALEQEYKSQKRLPPMELMRQSAPSREKTKESSVVTSTPTPGTPPAPSPAPPIMVGFSPPVPGYISDEADREQPDLLDIEHEVANIAHVLMYRQVEPPLALGLFGDWGSGKTFFMGKLQTYVKQVAENSRRQETTSGKEGKWCSRVAQIEFNAWHFSDANLWASLVTRIYEGLDQALNCVSHGHGPGFWTTEPTMIFSHEVVQMGPNIPNDPCHIHWLH